MKKSREITELRIMPFREKVIRLIFLAILFAFFLFIVGILKSDLAMYIAGCLYIYIFYCVYKGEVVFPIHFRNHTKNQK
ncbi:Zn-dependent membrane protease YugP [Rhizobium lusitanum]|uniref:Zn-dependent membrane protease YugP n=1 Tax=Rhizobium lusitanum TaxID=293958 RepID=A0A7X0IL51_9HYPH|nr:Zn-dependent membrane protease YugP [Rhizobium lusitanum]